MLFLQGSRDALVETGLLRQTVTDLGDRASLDLIADADHAFHVPARTGRTDAEVLASALATAARWMARTAKA